MTNIALISKIEFFEDSAPINIRFTQESARYEDKNTWTAAGHLHKHTLKFNISRLGGGLHRFIGRLRRARMIRFYDVNGLSIQLGREDLPITIVVDETVSGKLGGFRGYEVSVTWESREPAPLESFM